VKGNIAPPACYCINIDFPLEMLLTTIFKEHDEKTMILHHMNVMAGAHSKGANKGWNRSFDKLAASLKVVLK